MTQMTHLEFIKNTVAYYSENPKRRSIRILRGKFSGCSYSPTYFTENDNEISPDSKGCAIGRFMTSAQKIAADEDGSFIAALDKDLIPKKLKHFPVKFLSDVQRLHDRSDYWTSTGLSHKGEEYVRTLKRLWT